MRTKRTRISDMGYSINNKSDDERTKRIREIIRRERGAGPCKAKADIKAT